MNPFCLIYFDSLDEAKPDLNIATTFCVSGSVGDSESLHDVDL